MKKLFRLVPTALLLSVASLAQADPPSVSYIFPAGGQRGTTVPFRIGGHNLHDFGLLESRGAGVVFPPRIERTQTIWFEGPVIPQPPSQRQEDYPKDYAGEAKIAADAEPGVRLWRVSTSQGITSWMKFVVGDLPEIVEQEIDGDPVPQAIEFPVVVNGRIFPREDVDIWTVTLKAGQTITCEVNAARIGSPLDSRLEVRDPSGRRIVENVDALGVDSLVQFTAETDGDYAIHIHDVNFGGLQHYVYRLTVTDAPYINHIFPLGGRKDAETRFELAGANMPPGPVTVRLPAAVNAAYPFRATFDGRASNPVRIDVDDLPEFLEDPQPTAGGQSFSVPAALNGRIAAAGEIDAWSFTGKKGEAIRFDLFASRLGSPLDSILTVIDAAGKVLGTHDDLGGGQTDSQLLFTVPEDGAYVVQIRDQLASRGGLEFAYRLKAVLSEPASAAAAGLKVVFPSDVIVVERGGKEVKLRVDLERTGGLQEEVQIVFENLPEGITVTGDKIGKGRPNTTVGLTADAGAKLQTLVLKAHGKAVVEKIEKVNGKNVVVESTEVTGPVVPKQVPGEPEGEDITLAVAVATPFKFTGVFESKYAPRGSIFLRSYTIERNGFEGPIEVSLADKQARHLQGVSGPTIVVPPGETSFDYPVQLPTFLEIGRTSRTTLMAVGVIEEPDGSQHKVSYSSVEQSDQIIVLTDPGRLSLRTMRQSMKAVPDENETIEFEVNRGNGLKGPVTVELLTPVHIKGISAAPVTIPAGESRGRLSIRIEGKAGPFNMPLVVRATIDDESGRPVIAESKLTVVGG